MGRFHVSFILGDIAVAYWRVYNLILSEKLASQGEIEVGLIEIWIANLRVLDNSVFGRVGPGIEQTHRWM